MSLKNFVIGRHQILGANVTITHSPGTKTSANNSEQKRYADAIIVGAGVSGIGAAVHFQHNNPGDDFLILDAQNSYGGTWWTHRYPGARSDSDLYTYGYEFKPWTGPALADADMILDYLSEVIDEHDLSQHIHYEHTITTASWSTEEGRWTLTVYRHATDDWVQFKTKFLLMGQGYYDHQNPYNPSWDGQDQFNGPIVHAQTWPEDLAYADKNVVVIGSGATAGTLIPALAEQAKHVTMLQRTPSYYIPRPVPQEFEETLTGLDLSDDIQYEVLRQKNIQDNDWVARMFHEDPEQLKEILLEPLKDLLPDDLDIEKHFQPPYDPWQQRIVTSKNGDLFQAISNGTVSVVTDSVDHFTESGIVTASGEHIEADIIACATGFNMSIFGNIDFVVDEEVVDFSERVTWRGLMIEGIPNMVYMFGYWRHSWTLRIDMVNHFIDRLLCHMDSNDASMVVPKLRDQDVDMPKLPFSDPDDFNPGYVMRKQEVLFKQGDRQPWVHLLDYEIEREIMPYADLDDGLEYH